MSTVADKKGLKRICRECSARFYDFNKRPIVCPSCSAEHLGNIVSKDKRAEPKETKKKPANDETEIKKEEIAETDSPKNVDKDVDSDSDDVLDDEDLASLEEVEMLEDVDLDLDDEDLGLAEEDLGDLGNLDDLDLDEDDGGDLEEEKEDN